jgi:hypothetical protein
MALEDTLRFLEGHLTLYYAGIDSDSLPFPEGSRLVKRCSASQTIYLKALALVADYIVVPPSFYFFWANTHRNPAFFSHLLELYQAGIVVSPIYTSMNMGTDFLEQKSSQGSSADRNLIQANRDILVPFFREMPVFHRNVRRQSSGYKELFTRELPLLGGSHQLKRETESFINSPQQAEVLLSREQLLTFLSAAHNSQRVSTGDFRRYFYAANRSYYRQGAITYDGAISLLGAERYSILGQQVFRPPCGVLIAYDPLVVLGILGSLGISRNMIASLPTDDLIAVRRTTAFAAFRDAYRTFALSLQELAMHTGSVSRNVLLDLSHSIQTAAVSRVLTEEKLYSDRQRLWNIGEMSFFSLALGVAGFFVIPLIGAALGAVPILVYGFRLTPKLSDFVISRLTEKQLPFCVFVRELRAITEHMKTQQQGGGDSLPTRASP